MSDALQALLQRVAVPETQPFPATSRYYNLEIATFRRSDGVEVAYVRRRIVPSPERFQPLVEHTVTQGDRLDNIAAKYLGDPEQYWRICDANGVLRPDELTETAGRRIIIALPEGATESPRA